MSATSETQSALAAALSGLSIQPPAESAGATSTSLVRTSLPARRVSRSEDSKVGPSSQKAAEVVESILGKATVAAYSQPAPRITKVRLSTLGDVLAEALQCLSLDNVGVIEDYGLIGTAQDIEKILRAECAKVNKGYCAKISKM